MSNLDTQGMARSGSGMRSTANRLEAHGRVESPDEGPRAILESAQRLDLQAARPRRGSNLHQPQKFATLPFGGFPPANEEDRRGGPGSQRESSGTPLAGRQRPHDLFHPARPLPMEILLGGRPPAPASLGASPRLWASSAKQQDHRRHGTGDTPWEKDGVGTGSLPATGDRHERSGRAP